MFSKSLHAVAAVGTLMFVAGCANQRVPAEAALQAAEQAVAAIRPEAEQYASDGLKTVDDELAFIKKSIDEKKYGAAMSAAKNATDKVKELEQAVVAKKDELTKGWGPMADSLTTMVGQLETRVAQLSSSRRLPAGMTKDQVSEAKVSVQQLKDSWTEAAESFKGGKLAEAMTMAASVKSKAAELMKMLGSTGA